MGFEPTTSRLRGERSTAVLHPRPLPRNRSVKSTFCLIRRIEKFDKLASRTSFFIWRSCPNNKALDWVGSFDSDQKGSSDVTSRLPHSNRLPASFLKFKEKREHVFFATRLLFWRSFVLILHRLEEKAFNFLAQNKKWANTKAVVVAKWLINCLITIGRGF